MSTSKSKILFVGDLGNDLSEQDLVECFSEFGNVTYLRIQKYRSTKESMGYGLIQMSGYEEAERAVLTLNESTQFGRKFRVRFICGDLLASKQWFLKPRRNSLFVKFDSFELGKQVDDNKITAIFSHFGKIVDAAVSKSFVVPVS